jgi:hypothetical protein
MVPPSVPQVARQVSERMSEPLTPYQFPSGTKIISYCPLSECSWQHHDGPLPEGSGATIDEAVTDILTKHFAALEEICQAHLETHSLLEWVEEVTRLGGELAKLRGIVTDARSALGCEFPYAPHGAFKVTPA